MNTPTKKLRLGPLPKTESTKLTFSCSVGPQADLDRYAALHAQTYGEMVDAATLIPHMLEAFMTGDRGFGFGQQDLRSRLLRWTHHRPRLTLALVSADLPQQSGFVYL